MTAAAWLPSAAEAETDFPLANLPYGAFSALGREARLGVAIGDQILDLRAADAVGLLAGLPEALRAACRQPVLNSLMEQDPARLSQLRRRLTELLSASHESDRERTARALLPQAEATLQLPAAIGDYTDFYASVHHATNVGKLFRPTNPLLPNYKYVPVGYHGRSSSVVVSPERIRRPVGQLPGPEGAAPSFAPTRQLDYELEVGIFVGQGNALGHPIPMVAAESHIFGLCLLNDWSARDMQRWEYQPLGPFLAKNFATSISPWVVTMEALAPYRVPAAERPAGDPEPLPYLDAVGNRAAGGLNMTVEAWLQTDRMRREKLAPVRLSRANFRDLYWTMAQLLVHHASNGCNLRSGDLLGSGTISGPEPEARGCLLELTSGGREPVTLPGGETRAFLENGDEITLRAYCQKAGAARIGWGECRGRIVPAVEV